MSLYKEIENIVEYCSSIRKLKTYLSFDISFPKTWKLPKKYVIEDKVVEQQSSVENERMFSFVCEITEESVELIYNNIQGIIKYNLEREEKERLFEDKVNELKSIFEKQNLNSLQALKFDINEPKLELEDEEETAEPTGRDAGLVEERD